MGVRRNRSTSTYWIASAIIVAIIGVGTTIYAGVSAGRVVQNSLLERTDSIARLIPAGTVNSFEGSLKDLESDQYKDLKQRLTQLRANNHDIRFLYLLGQRAERSDSFFYVDSEAPDSEDYSYPGQAYPEGNADVARVYTLGTGSVLPITQDRWGNWLSAFSPIKDSSGKVVAVVGIDIPASDYYQQVVLTAALPLLMVLIILFRIFWGMRRAKYQQNYLTEKAFFLSFASHEIRSPLTSVSWALQALKSKTIPPEKESIFLARTENSVRHILETIEDVLNLQNTEALKTKSLTLTEESIHTLLQLTLDNLSLVAAEKKCEIIDTTNPNDYNFVAKIDVPLFKRVLSNLLINAMKYSPEHEPIMLRFYSKKNGWAISFHNSGDPISKEDQAKIFSGYYRTKKAEASNQRGTGLGLMLSKEIIEQHGGTLELESSKQKGTTFTIVMPN